jgi:hypothetical protein
MRYSEKDLLGKKKAVAALDACEYVYIQLLLLPQQIALYIEKHSSLIKEEAATRPQNYASRWYLQVLDDGGRVLVCLGLAAEVAGDGL